MSNLTYANDAEKEYKKFIKETNKIRKQLDKLPTETSDELTVIDEAIKELDQAFDFANENFKENKIEITKITLDYIDKSLADISKLAPKEFSNDLSVVDMKSLPKENFQEIMETSKQMKIIKNEKITSLVENMTIVEKEGLNLFQVSKNLNELGVNTLNFEDIAKVVSENSSLKEDVLNASKKGISEEDYTKQLETIAEAERLGITESTAAVADAAKSQNLDVDAMPTLETMQSDFFDAAAHNEAMAEMAAEISSGDIGSDTAKAEAAASYSESDRADQKSKSDADAESTATEACPSC
ncbi:hypothetical protein [Candidatus Pelagibacter communis]|uniref:hypothetical protein n=1 Tax=Pelagibacter ubique TaxID=198252 RepID=UPI000409A23A|nr:hypothetical protein [Candidatus Pelagibacter ubique]